MEPLTARSVLASALLGTEPPEMSARQLIRLASLFGVNENRARVALSRMAAAGEVVSVGGARYRLAGDLIERQRRQVASRSGATMPFNGAWTVIVLHQRATSAAERSARRATLTRARLAERREGVWMRPANIEVSLDLSVISDADQLVATPSHDARQLAHELFDPQRWAIVASELLALLEAAHDHGIDELAQDFELSAAVLRHFQADPLLPDELLPPRWPGGELREVYDRFDASYRATLATWHRANGARLASG